MPSTRSLLSGANLRSPVPAFSVLCSAYRTERYLAQTIESVLAQTRSDWELIVVDNGMSDEIARIVAGYSHDSRIRLVRQENRGIGGGVDAAAHAARGRYFTVLHSDDQLLPDYCTRIGAVLDARPDIDALACDSYVFADADGCGDLPHSYLHYVGGKRRPSLRHRVTLADVVGGATLYYAGTFRRAAWEAAGGYRSDTPKVEDLSLWLRLVGAGFDVRVLAERLGRYRIRADSESRDANSVEEFERSRERALLAAAAESGRPEDRSAVAQTLTEARYFQGLRRARWALLDGDVAAARTAAAAAFRQRRTVRSGVVLAGLHLAPGVLRRVHPVKRAMSLRATRLAGRACHAVRRLSA